MVSQGNQPPEKIAKDIQQEVEEEIARAKSLARELNKNKGHNSL
jgi:hypothetical protein